MEQNRSAFPVCAEPLTLRRKYGAKAPSVFCIGSAKGSRQNRLCNISYDHIWKKQLLSGVTYGWVGTMPRNLNVPPRRVSPGSILHPRRQRDKQRRIPGEENHIHLCQDQSCCGALAVGKCQGSLLWQWLSLNQGSYEWSPNPSA